MIPKSTFDAWPFHFPFIIRPQTRCWNCLDQILTKEKRKKNLNEIQYRKNEMRIFSDHFSMVENVKHSKLICWHKIFCLCTVTLVFFGYILQFVLLLFLMIIFFFFSLLWYATPASASTPAVGISCCISFVALIWFNVFEFWMCYRIWILYFVFSIAAKWKKTISWVEK